MRNIYKINDELSVEKVVKKNKTIMLLIRNGKKTVLDSMKTWDSFFCKLVYDDNYIVVYSRGTMANQIPLNIEVAYSIKHNKYVNLQNKRLKVLLEYMFISRRGFDLTEVLSAINDRDLGLIEPGRSNELIEYLLAGSDKVEKQVAIDYIFQCYPIFKKYTNLTGPISVVEYKKLTEEIGTETFWFHMMPLDIELVDVFAISPRNPNATNYKQIYISENEFLKNHKYKIMMS